jgi:hypothetical protein
MSSNIFEPAMFCRRLASYSAALLTSASEVGGVEDMAGRELRPIDVSDLGLNEKECARRLVKIRIAGRPQ